MVTRENPTGPNIPLKPAKPIPANQKDDRDTVNIDGNKLADFIGAVRSMSDTLQRLNIGAIMDAFVVGANHEAIDYAIEQGKKWQNMSEALTNYTKETTHNLNLLNVGVKTHMSHMKQLFDFLDDPRTRKSMDVLHDMYKIIHALAAQKKDLLIIVRTMVDEYEKDSKK